MLHAPHHNKITHCISDLDKTSRRADCDDYTTGAPEIRQLSIPLTGRLGRYPVRNLLRLGPSLPPVTQVLPEQPGMGLPGPLPQIRSRGQGTSVHRVPDFVGKRSQWSTDGAPLPFQSHGQGAARLQPTWDGGSRIDRTGLLVNYGRVLGVTDRRLREELEREGSIHLCRQRDCAHPAALHCRCYAAVDSEALVDLGAYGRNVGEQACRWLAEPFSGSIPGPRSVRRPQANPTKAPNASALSTLQNIHRPDWSIKYPAHPPRVDADPGWARVENTRPTAHSTKRDTLHHPQLMSPSVEDEADPFGAPVNPNGGVGGEREELSLCFSRRRRTKGAGRPARCCSCRYGWCLRLNLEGGTKWAVLHPTTPSQEVARSAATRATRHEPWLGL